MNRLKFFLKTIFKLERDAEYNTKMFESFVKLAQGQAQTYKKRRKEELSMQLTVPV